MDTSTIEGSVRTAVPSLYYPYSKTPGAPCFFRRSLFFKEDGPCMKDYRNPEEICTHTASMDAGDSRSFPGLEAQKEIQALLISESRNEKSPHPEGQAGSVTGCYRFLVTVNWQSKWYYLQHDGTMATNQWIYSFENREAYYVNENGVWVETRDMENPSQSCVVQVVNPAGEPLAHMPVYVWKDKMAEGNNPYYMGYTDSLGKAYFSLSPGFYTVRVDVSGWRGTSADVHISDYSSSEPVVLMVEPL